MKFSHILSAALSGASLSLAQTGVSCPATTGLPECGIACLIEAAVIIDCMIEDIACQCTSSAQLESAASSCIYASCTDQAEVDQVTSAAQAICEQCMTAPTAATPAATPI